MMIGKTLKLLRQARHYTLDDLSTITGLHRSTLWGIEQDKNSSMHPQTWRKLAQAYVLSSTQLQQFCEVVASEKQTAIQSMLDQIKQAWLNDRMQYPAPTNLPPISQSQAPNTQPQGPPIPLFESIPASPPQSSGDAQYPSETFIQRTLLQGLTDPSAISVRVQGNSMAPEYNEGDVVVLSPNATHEHGIITGLVYAIWLDGDAGDEATLKRVKIVSPKLWQLVPSNPNFDILEVDPMTIRRMDLAVSKFVLASNVQNISQGNVIETQT